MYSSRRKLKPVRVWVLLLILAGLVTAGFFGASGADVRESRQQAITEAVQQSAVQCYCIEGAYPESLEYLEEHYGLRVNTEDYYVEYRVFSSNVMPTVSVVPRISSETAR